MIREIPSLQNDNVNIQDHTSSNIKNRNTMDMRRDNRQDMTFRGPTQAQMMSKQEYIQTLSSQNSTRRLITKSSYFSLESMVVLVGLTASLLFLPLILPPLPPPPFMLLLVPIGIMVLLMVLALMPSSNAKHVTGTYMRLKVRDRKQDYRYSFYIHSMIIGSIWISKNYALEVAEIPTTCFNLKLKSKI
ncbi:unnamed protein product [Brassica oleracea var. botrytis]|uniref:ARGOS-like protein n=1 Tax=Brassica oleracea TaxID=3712 RepID=A0A3P6B1J0_BRAOL|nr:unnamed protein product [Brassica oleracea]